MTAVAPNQQTLSQSQDSSSSVDQLPVVSQVWEGPEPLYFGEGSENNLILWTDKEKKTPLAPSVVEWMKSLKEVRDQSQKMIERIRCSAQPNPAFRGKRLIPSRANTVSDRMQFIQSLNQFRGVCFATQLELQAYAKTLVEVEVKIDQAHEMFLRQVVGYSVQPLIDFVNKCYPFYLNLYSGLLKSRNQYDRIRSKANAEKTMASRKQFAESGRFVYKNLTEMPKQQLTVAQAVDNYLRAELEFAQNMMGASAGFKPPNHVSWWNPENASQEGTQSKSV